VKISCGINEGRPLLTELLPVPAVLIFGFLWLKDESHCIEVLIKAKALPQHQHALLLQSWYNQQRRKPDQNNL